MLGEHRGLPYYTIGQRKGLGIAAPRPLYVLALDTARNAVVVGTAEGTGKRSTRWVLAVAHEAGFEIPAAIRDSMSAGLAGFVEGRVRRGSALATADLAIRKLAAVEALSRYGKAKSALLGSVTVEPTLWPTSAVIDWIGVLKRVGDIPERAKKLAAAQQILRHQRGPDAAHQLRPARHHDPAP